MTCSAIRLPLIDQICKFGNDSMRNFRPGSESWMSVSLSFCFLIIPGIANRSVLRRSLRSSDVNFVRLRNSFNPASEIVGNP